MKKNSLIQELVCLLLLFVLTFVACKKTEVVSIEVEQPVAKFSVLITDPQFGQQTQGAVTYIDSNFYFRNTSDSSEKITYKWDFGDGTISTDKSPKHGYAKRGTYKVKLIVSNENRAFDSAQQMLTVVLGQQHISFGESVNLSPVAIEETVANEFVLLASAGYGATYYLLQLDSLLKQKSMKTFPAGYRLLSMKATNDGNYIFTGSTQATNKSNELIKMKADGTQLWNKTLSADESYSFAAPTPDGGYAVVGSQAVSGGGNTTFNTVVIKTDDNGNQLWKKVLNNEGMINTRDAVMEQDGIVVAGTKRGACMECDSILVVKLNNAGGVVWKKTVLGGMNNFVWWDTRIAKLTNGNYAVTNGYTRGIFFFSPSGEFLDRKLAPSQVEGVISASDGGILALQTASGNGFRIAVSKLTLEGDQQWNAYPDGGQKVPGGYRCCSDSRPIAIQPLRKGGTIVTGYRIDANSTGFSYHNVIVLLELGEDGKPK